MPLDLFQTLIAIEGEDGQLKTAAKKLGHEPEMGQMDAGGVASGLGQSLGRGPMDAKALMDERALEVAGTDLEGRTFGQDPREAPGARNLANKAGPGPSQPVRISPQSKPSNTHLPKTGPAVHRPDSLVHKTGGLKDIAAKALAKGRAGAKAVAKPFKATKNTFQSSMRGQAAHHATKGRSGASKAMHAAVKTTKKHPFVVGGTAAAAGAAGYGAAKAGRKKAASLTLASFLALQNSEAGMKLASETFGQDEILARTIQARRAQSTGMKIACGMFAGAAAARAE